MGLKLYNYGLSGNCYKVRLLLGFLKLDYEIVPVDFYPGLEHKQPDFLDINPLGQLPVLEDGRVRLRDSQAILSYIAKKYDPSASWLPDRDATKFSQIMMWLAFAGNNLVAAAADRLVDSSATFSAPEIDKGRQALTILDDQLAERSMMGHSWIVGETPTIADIACFPDAALSNYVGIDHEAFPHLRNWMRDFRRLPNFLTMPGIPEFA